jgi:predicted RND superfamily exporter protein
LALLVTELRQMDDVDAAVSVLNFLPGLPPETSGGISAVCQRAAIEGWINRHQERLRDLRFFDRVEDDTNNEAGCYWRVSLRVSTQKKLNYAVMIADVEKRIEKIKSADDTIAPNVRFDVTGGVPLVFRAQEMLLWDLIYSFMTAFGLIALTMMIVLHGVVRGLLAMIPNIFPCVIVFGTLGFFGIPVDMGSMMTASVALGISVDSTLHLLTWVNIALRRGHPRKDAVLYALQRCSTALAQTAIICGVGMLAFGWSDFVPVSRFAVLLCTILMISLTGAIVALPAILFSPLGRFFEIADTNKKNVWRL